MTPPPPRRGLRYALAGLLPGASARRAQIAEFAEEWSQWNAAACGADGPLWLVLGDSTAQAIGASSIERGYVGLVLARLRQRDPSWRAVNLSRSGARAVDAVDEQLPRLGRLRPDLVSCAIGVNDLLRPRRAGTAAALGLIAAAMPPGSVLATLPRGVRERRAVPLNEVVHRLADEHGHRIADLWAKTGPPYEGRFSTDHFHPNDRGYEAWADAFDEALGLS